MQPPTAGRSDRPKVAVIAWDLGHNPLGRAHVLAGVLSRRFDVEIWGAHFERFGSNVWAPLRNSEIPIRGFQGRSFPEHLDVMHDVARKIDADALWVSKPRLPSLALGVFAKQHHGRPLVLDVDDRELAFFGDERALEPRRLLRSRRAADLSVPFGRTWTRVCEPFVDAADGLTVSNAALQARFGGVVVPHARDETVFDPTLHDRNETRRRLGIDPAQRLLLFGGTPRAHKGVVEILRALDQIGDDRYRLLAFGTHEFDQLRAQLGELERWAVVLPYQDFSDLPALVGAADLACVLQDPTHPVAGYQLPAKITDALAMGVPCLVRPTPPMRELVNADILHVLGEGEPLAERIPRVFDHYDDAIERARKGREIFLTGYSYAAVSETISPMFAELLSDPPRLSPRLAELASLPGRVFAKRGEPVERVTSEPRVPRRRPRPIEGGAPYDIVMLWRKNDTGIYGRRQDMFLKYLARSDRVHSIVHFDNPTTIESLVKRWAEAKGSTDQGRLVVRQTLGRILRRRPRQKPYRHTFLHGGKYTRHIGFPDHARYPEYIRATLARHGFGTRPIVCWVYPTNPDLPAVIDALDPDLVVADVVDDNRTWYTEHSPDYDNATRNYAEVLTRADVAIANCRPVAEAMSQFARHVHVVANGCELPDGSPEPPRPKELERLAGPIVGYVGNLSSRLDIPLLARVAQARRDWNFVFVGSTHLDRSILQLESEPNVHFVGVKPYDESVRFVRHFDVAIIPHLDNEMTRSMNPLKAFVYCAAGVPVVSTPVANLDELAELITIANGPAEFVSAIERALRARRAPPNLDVLRRHSWEERVARALDLVDAAAVARDGR